MAFCCVYVNRSDKLSSHNSHYSTREINPVMYKAHEMASLVRDDDYPLVHMQASRNTDDLPSIPQE